MITTTLKDLRAKGACFEGYNRVVRMLQGKEFTGKDAVRESYIRFDHKDQISLIDIAKNNGLDDALWALRASTATDRDCRLFAVWCARQVQSLVCDSRNINAIDVSERYANGVATEDELASAWVAARDAALAAARAAAYSLPQHRAAEWTAALRAAWAAARYKQKEMFILMCKGEAPWQKK